MSFKNILCISCVVMIFVACSDDSSSSGVTNVKSNDVDSYATIDDLPNCTPKREGVEAFVKDKNASYICSESKWKNVGTTYQSSSSSQQENYQNTIIPIENKTIRGISTLTGANISLYELDGKTLGQTGKNFKGKMSNDNGEFSVSNVNLTSQYALLEATGYYYNASTNKNSTSTITLNALVDLSNRDSANINFMTHLEYERILELVTKEKMDVKKAKQQAQKDAFASFYINSDGFKPSEDLYIYGNTDGDTALFTVSYLLYKGQSEVTLTNRLTKISDDLSDDGEWNDEVTITEIADSIALGTLNRAIALGTLNRYLKNYWQTVYGLGECTSSRDGETRKNKLEKSKLDYFTCDWGNDEVWSWRLSELVERILERGCTKLSIGTKIEEKSLECVQDDNFSKPYWRAIKGKTKTGTMVDSRDNKIYKTVSIAMQIWMAENLKYEAGCLNHPMGYPNECLYDWYAATDGDIDRFEKNTIYPIQGICPSGWHLPTYQEWETLFTLTYYQPSDGYFFDLLRNEGSSFWSATLGSNSVRCNNGRCYRGNDSESAKLSVRCIKDEEGMPASKKIKSSSSAIVSSSSVSVFEITKTQGAGAIKLPKGTSNVVLSVDANKNIVFCNVDRDDSPSGALNGMVNKTAMKGSDYIAVSVPAGTLVKGATLEFTLDVPATCGVQ